MWKNRSAIANDFTNSLGDMCDACTYIKDAGACGNCPLKYNCIEECNVLTFADDVSRSTINEFLGFADDIEEQLNQQDFEDYHEQLKAEMERELWEN